MNNTQYLRYALFAFALLCSTQQTQTMSLQLLTDEEINSLDLPEDQKKEIRLAKIIPDFIAGPEINIFDRKEEKRKAEKTLKELFKKIREEQDIDGVIFIQ